MGLGVLGLRDGRVLGLRAFRVLRVLGDNGFGGLGLRV